MRIAHFIITFPFLSALALATAQALGAEKPCSPPENPFKKTQESAAAILTPLKKLKEKSHTVGTDSQVSSAKCLQTTPPSLTEIEAWIARMRSNDETASRTIHGIKFENESQKLLQWFEQLTTYHPSVHETTSRTYVSSKQRNFTSTCSKVDCAVKELFGNAAGPKLFYMMGKYGFNGSHIAHSKARAWRAEDLDPLLLAMSDFPPHLLPFETDKKLIHDEQNLGPYYPVLANAHIEVFSSWDFQTPNEQRSAIFHELGHYLTDLRLDESPRWQEVGGWKKINSSVSKHEGWRSDQPDELVSRYAASDPIEDFAETITAYRYDPTSLKRIAPEKYEFMKTLFFDGIEYTDEEACKRTPQAHKLIHSGQYQVLDSDMEYSLKSCGNLILASLNTASSNIPPDAMECLERTVSVPGVIRKIERQHPHYKDLFIQSPIITGLPRRSDLSSKLERFALNKLKSSLVTLANTLDAQRRSLHYEVTSSIPEYCKSWSRKAHLWADDLTQTFNHNKLAPLTDDQRITLDRLMHDVCVDVQSQHTERVPLKAEELEAAIDDLMRGSWAAGAKKYPVPAKGDISFVGAVSRTGF